MQKIIIDQEFKDLLPPLDSETFALLEENILEHGCRDSLVLWQGILIDGHNRYAICTKHKIPFSTTTKDFATREDVLIWIISTQVARRNLTPLQLSHCRGLHYQADKRIIANESGKNQHSKMAAEAKNLAKLQVSEVSGHNDHQAPDASTANRLAEQYHVSPKTVRRDAKVAATIDALGELSPNAKKKILSGEVAIDKKELEALATLPNKELIKLAKAIDKGSYDKSTFSHTAPANEGLPSFDPKGTQKASALLKTATNDFQRELQLLAINSDSADRNVALKAALKAHLTKLEGIYKRL
ncbi:MAG: hypothetical protein LBB42_00665 [Coriobacteriales bacterium]|jgi:hypothetical protein|nr:hypothetical protein [Coriobacteriales bacterium]